MIGAPVLQAHLEALLADYVGSSCQLSGFLNKESAAQKVWNLYLQVTLLYWMLPWECDKSNEEVLPKSPWHSAALRERCQTQECSCLRFRDSPNSVWPSIQEYSKYQRLDESPSRQVQMQPMQCFICYKIYICTSTSHSAWLISCVTNEIDRRDENKVAASWYNSRHAYLPWRNVHTFGTLSTRPSDVI